MYSVRLKEQHVSIVPNNKKIYIDDREYAQRNKFLKPAAKIIFFSILNHVFVRLHKNRLQNITYNSILYVYARNINIFDKVGSFTLTVG